MERIYKDTDKRERFRIIITEPQDEEIKIIEIQSSDKTKEIECYIYSLSSDCNNLICNTRFVKICDEKRINILSARKKYSRAFNYYKFVGTILEKALKYFDTGLVDTAGIADEIVNGTENTDTNL